MGFEERLIEVLEQRDAARAALGVAEWSGPPDAWIDERDEWCPWCGNYRRVGHRADCQRQLALGMAA